jgi:hypothetical protein
MERGNLFFVVRNITPTTSKDGRAPSLLYAHPVALTARNNTCPQ